MARFGVFEADLRAGELRKSGIKLRLTGQPFQVLAVLLERAGEVVTREELQQKLWAYSSFRRSNGQSSRLARHFIPSPFTAAVNGSA